MTFIFFIYNTGTHQKGDTLKKERRCASFFSLRNPKSFLFLFIFLKYKFIYFNWRLITLQILFLTSAMFPISYKVTHVLQAEVLVKENVI